MTYKRFQAVRFRRVPFAEFYVGRFWKDKAVNHIENPLKNLLRNPQLNELVLLVYFRYEYSCVGRLVLGNRVKNP